MKKGQRRRKVIEKNVIRVVIRKKKKTRPEKEMCACAKLIIQAGVKRGVYSEAYRNTSGVDFLRKNNIKCKKLTVTDVVRI